MERRKEERKRLFVTSGEGGIATLQWNADVVATRVRTMTEMVHGYYGQRTMLSTAVNTRQRYNEFPVDGQCLSLIHILLQQRNIETVDNEY